MSAFTVDCTVLQCSGHVSTFTMDCKSSHCGLHYLFIVSAANLTLDLDASLANPKLDLDDAKPQVDPGRVHAQPHVDCDTLGLNASPTNPKLTLDASTPNSMLTLTPWV